MTRLYNWTELAEQFRQAQLAGDEPPDSFWGNLRARIAAWCKQHFPNDTDELREDIVQEACIRVFTHRDTIRTETFGAYIQTIIRNIRTDLLKVHSRHATSVPIEYAVEHANTDTTIYENTMFHASIDPHLTPTEREFLRYIEEGYTMREIARLMGYTTPRCTAFRKPWRSFVDRMRALLRENDHAKTN